MGSETKYHDTDNILECRAWEVGGVPHALGRVVQGAPPRAPFHHQQGERLPGSLGCGRGALLVPTYTEETGAQTFRSSSTVL